MLFYFFVMKWNGILNKCLIFLLALNLRKSLHAKKMKFTATSAILRYWICCLCGLFRHMMANVIHAHPTNEKNAQCPHEMNNSVWLDWLAVVKCTQDICNVGRTGFVWYNTFYIKDLTVWFLVIIKNICIIHQRS